MGTIKYKIFNSKGEYMVEKILILVFCHLIGDYVLQCDFIAKTKGENLYHLFIHSMLYCLPFYIVFGMNVELLLLFVSHIVIDALKARCKKFGYIEDQLLHYYFIGIYLI